MRIFRSLAEAKAAKLVRPVATLGVFDGVHLGHQRVIARVVELARERGASSVIVTFSRHPRAVIRGEAPKLITSLPHRLRLFEQLGVDASLVLEFDETLRAMPAREFAASVFGEALGASQVVLGYNNRFGRGGEGHLGILREVGKALGFDAEAAAEVRFGDEKVSSTVIREAILGGEVERASRLLGRPFSVLGRVVHGDGLGRRLGVPTANLDLQHEVRPPPGVYGCEVEIGGRRSFGLVNIGTRPTVTGVESAEEGDAWERRDRQERIEVHVLDLTPDLYGQDLEVVFLVRLRGEQRFPGLDALVRQIREDEARLRAWLAERAATSPVDR